MIGRLSVSASWQILYLWTIELLPTTVRATVLATCMLVGRLGGSVAPIIYDLVRSKARCLKVNSGVVSCLDTAKDILAD